METADRDLLEHLQSLFERSMVEEVTYRIPIHGMLGDFADVFIGPDCQLGPTTVEPHRIDTGTHPPVKQRAYRMLQEGHRIVDKECQKMLEKGVIKKSNSP
jgi:hypothetical protein